MKKSTEAGASAKTAPGNTSYTGNNVLCRTQINALEEEPDVRGKRVSKEAIRIVHKQLLAAVPYECFEAVFTNHGGIVDEEV